MTDFDSPRLIPLTKSVIPLKKSVIPLTKSVIPLEKSVIPLTKSVKMEVFFFVSPIEASVVYNVILT